MSTKRYAISITDVDTDEEVFLTAADWTLEEQRAAVAAIMRLVGLPGDNCLTAAPDDPPKPG